MATANLYIVSDGKPGHLAQSQGLAGAIQRIASATIETINCEKPRDTPQQAGGTGLIIATGRGTHRPALAMRQRLGLTAIVLMNPGWLMRRRFDLCIIPRHDGISESDSVIVTDGALNAVSPANDASMSEGLLLIGGPSKHHAWDAAAVGRQLVSILDRDPDVSWTATGSRRTPDATDRLMRQLASEYTNRLAYTPASQTPRGWVAEQLQRCGLCWVSEDSVSMVYEALTAGAAVGLLEVPRKGSPGRVVRGMDDLVSREMVTTFASWHDGEPLQNNRAPLAEAERVARLVVQHFPATFGSGGA
jgi:hypothetical protein